MHPKITHAVQLATTTFCVYFLSGCATQPVAPPATLSAVEAGQLMGRWTVDLRSSPSDAVYTQPFVVETVDAANRSITGSFYNSTIAWSRINTSWGRVVVTFVTSDGQGEYVHTATLESGKLAGTSTARHRNMLVPWTAVRENK